MQKARSLVSDLTAVEENMMSKYTQGVVGGFKKESGTELYWCPYILSNTFQHDPTRIMIPT